MCFERKSFVGYIRATVFRLAKRPNVIGSYQSFGGKASSFFIYDLNTEASCCCRALSRGIIFFRTVGNYSPLIVQHLAIVTASFLLSFHTFSNVSLFVLLYPEHNTVQQYLFRTFNPLNPELNPIC
jgi:hypothetical protein